MNDKMLNTCAICGEIITGDVIKNVEAETLCESCSLLCPTMAVMQITSGHKAGWWFASCTFGSEEVSTGFYKRRSDAVERVLAISDFMDWQYKPVEDE